MTPSIGAEKSFLKIQHRFLRGTFSKILGIDGQVDICGGFMVGGTPQLNSLSRLGKSPLSGFWWEAE